jgi:hypothetical protein
MGERKARLLDLAERAFHESLRPSALPRDAQRD